MDETQIPEQDLHRRHMRRALRLAVLGRHASPNPMVGCVLTDEDGAVLSEGYHVAPGLPHAEAAALRALDEAGRRRLRRAYVTLEPCSHFGRTPPCADALVQAGVREVRVAMLDPDVRVSGSGVARLRGAGVSVEIGLLEAEARALNAAYVKHRTSGIPYVVVKTAMTLDGKIATPSGDSRWITSAVSRKAVHRQLRDRCDAILTGRATVVHDDPEFTTRLTHRKGRDPWRIVVDSALRIPETARIVRRGAEDGKTILVATERVSPERVETFRSLGCQVIIEGADPDGRVSLPSLLATLGTRGDMVSVIVESGGELAAAVARQRLADRFLVFIAPKIAGGRLAPGPIGGDGVKFMKNADDLRFHSVRRSGSDVVIDAHWVECD